MFKKIFCCTAFISLGMGSMAYSMNYKGLVTAASLAACASYGAYRYYVANHQATVPAFAPAAVAAAAAVVSTAPVMAPAAVTAAAAVPVVQPSHPREIWMVYPKMMPNESQIAQAVADQSESPLVQMPREVLWHIASFLGANTEQDERNECADLHDVNNLFKSCRALYWKPFYHLPGEQQQAVFPLACSRDPNEKEEHFFNRLLRRLNLIAMRCQGVPDCAIHLNLNHCRLDKFAVLEQFLTRVAHMPIAQCVTKIDLSDNAISRLSEEIGSFANLKILKAESTFVRTVPSIIGNLANLEELDLSFTRVQVLPDELCKLVRLKKLLLTHSCCAELPENMGDLQALEVCNLGHCGLSRIPASMNNLGNLQKLNLCGNTIPEEQIAPLRRVGLTIIQGR